VAGFSFGLSGAVLSVADDIAVNTSVTTNRTQTLKLTCGFFSQRILTGSGRFECKHGGSPEAVLKQCVGISVLKSGFIQVSIKLTTIHLSYELFQT
jgi:hypothetical protein